VSPEAKAAIKIAGKLGAGSDSRHQIQTALEGLVPQLRGLYFTKKVSDLQRDLERERQRLAKLRQKYFWYGPGLPQLDRAIAILAALQKVSGPRKEVNVYIEPCIVMAAHMIRMHAQDKKVNPARVGIIAGYIYETITNIGGKKFVRAARAYCTSRSK